MHSLPASKGAARSPLGMQGADGFKASGTRDKGCELEKREFQPIATQALAPNISSVTFHMVREGIFLAMPCSHLDTTLAPCRRLTPGAMSVDSS